MYTQEPVKCVLDRHYKQNDKGEAIEIEDCSYDILLLGSLQRLLNCDEVCKQVSEYSPWNINVKNWYIKYSTCIWKLYIQFKESNHSQI